MNRRRQAARPSPNAESGAAHAWLSYEAYVRLHAAPRLGRVPLASLTPQHLQRLYTEKLAEGVAPATER
jgi:hypothetical protein